MRLIGCRGYEDQKKVQVSSGCNTQLSTCATLVYKSGIITVAAEGGG